MQLQRFLCIFMNTGKIPTIAKSPDGQPPTYHLPHPIWSKDEVEGVEITHTHPTDKTETVRSPLSVDIIEFDIFL